MYLIYLNLSSCAKTKKIYCYFIVRFHFCVIVNSMISLTLKNLYNTLHIDYVYSYTSICFKNSTLLLFVVLYFLYKKSYFCLEVNTFNINAFSLYFWLGYQILYQRNYYYHSFDNQVIVTRFSYTAYTLSLSKFYCKNMLRRTLILLNK